VKQVRSSSARSTQSTRVSVRALRSLSSLCVSLTLVAGGLVALAVPATAGSVVAASPTVSGCNGFSSAYKLGAAYRDSDVTIFACGPRPAFGGARTAVYAYPGAPSNPGYQCAEFAARYLYYKFGVTMYISTNGDQVVDHYASKYPKLFVAVKNGTIAHAPVQGDVISYSQTSSFDTIGHTSVVQSSSVDASGNGTITTVEENWSANGSHVVPVVNWKVQLGGYPYVKWLHAYSMSNGPLSAAPITIDAPNGLFTNLPIRQLMSITNTSSNSVGVQQVVFGIRAPDGSTSVESCAGNVTLAPGETMNCSGSTVWTQVGTYQVWPEWQDTGGIWYSGALGPSVSFTLAAGGVPSSPATVSASVGSDGVDLTWASPFSTGGPPLTGYVVTTSPATVRTVVQPDVTQMSLAGLKPNVTYSISVQAANVIGKSSAVSTVLEGSVLTATTTAAPVLYGGTTTLRGSLKSPSGAPRVAAPLTVQISTDGQNWADLQPLTTDSQGTYAMTFQPQLNASYRVNWAGTTAFRPITSAAVSIGVRPIIGAQFSVTKTRTNKAVTLAGTYQPAGAGVNLLVQRKLKKGWVTIATVSTDDSGAFSTTWLAHQAGVYPFRVLHASEAAYLWATTPVLNLTVTKK